MPASSHRPTLLVTRRTALAAAPLVGLAGCEWGPPTEQVEAPEPDADANVVEQARGEILARLDTVQATSTRHVGLSTALAALVVMHTAHLELLDADASTDRPSPPPVPVRPPVALAAVRSTEQALQARLAALAGEAVSGTFARALASMSASVAQHLAALPPVPRGTA